MDKKDEVIIKEELGENEVCVGIAETPQEKIGRLQVVTERYIGEKYLQGITFAITNLSAEEVVEENGISLLYDSLEEELFQKFLKEGLLIRFKGGEQLFYLDKYNWQSVPFVAKTRSGYVGSARLIISDMNTEYYDLPTSVRAT